MAGRPTNAERHEDYCSRLEEFREWAKGKTDTDGVTLTFIEAMTRAMELLMATFDGYAVHHKSPASMRLKPVALFRFQDHAAKFNAAEFSDACEVVPVSFAFEHGHGADIVDVDQAAAEPVEKASVAEAEPQEEPTILVGEIDWHKELAAEVGAMSRNYDKLAARVEKLERVIATPTVLPVVREQTATVAAQSIRPGQRLTELEREVALQLVKKSNGQGLTSLELARDTSVTPDRAQYVLSRLADAGLLRKDGRRRPSFAGRGKPAVVYKLV
jgi:hypothetical protein